MLVSVSDAKGQLTELVRRAEAGDEVVLTRHGKAVARLMPMSRRPTQQEKQAILKKISHAAAAKATPGADAARSQDFLYDDETGLPK
jgi:prevent-host-death family protein